MLRGTGLRGNRVRILLIEDEKRMAQALCEILRLEKYEVDHCADGMDGMCAVESGMYDGDSGCYAAAEKRI